MSIQFEAVDRAVPREHSLIWSISNFEFDETAVFAELQREDLWEGHLSRTPLPQSELRQSYMLGKGSRVLDELIGQVDGMKNDLIDKFYGSSSYEAFHKRWPLKPEKLKESVVSLTAVNRDYPGFFIHPHLDNRIVVGAVIINLKKNSHGTDFLSENGELEFTSDLEKGNGVLFVNSEFNRHMIKVTEDERLTIYSLLLLNI